MAYKKNYKRRKNVKKYSLNERINYHNRRFDRAAARAKDSASVFKLFKQPKMAYSVGFVDGVNGTTQFTEINVHGGNDEAYGKGVAAGVKALAKSRDAKF